MVPALTLIGSYLLGSIPFSYLVARRWGIEDVRRVGSGNVGATNVLRSAGAAAGLLAFVLDASKGALAALIAQWLAPSLPWLPAAAATSAVVGHIFPVWLRFRGGKGVATAAGAFLPLAPGAVVISLVAFGIALVVSRRVSVGSLVAATALPTASFALGAIPPVSWAALAVASIVVLKHRSNIERLIQGREERMGSSSE